MLSAKRVVGLSVLTRSAALAVATLFDFDVTERPVGLKRGQRVSQLD